MKKIIVILGTIILGVYIVSSLIMGGNGSLKGNADSIVHRGTTVITDTLLNVTPK